MTDHAITPGTAIPDRTVRAPVTADPAPQVEEKAPTAVEAEGPDHSSQTIAAASLFILPLVTFLLIVAMWLRIGGF